jgi:hypothetical protein
MPAAAVVSWSGGDPVLDPAAEAKAVTDKLTVAL